MRLLAHTRHQGSILPALALILLLIPHAGRCIDTKEAVRRAVAAHGGADSIVKAERGGVRKGSFKQYFPAPNSGTFVEYRKGEKVFIEVELAGLEVAQGYDGERAWVRSFGQVIDAPDQIRTAIEEELRHGLTVLADALNKDFLIEEVEPSATVDGVAIHGVRITPPGGVPATSFFFDPETQRVARISFTDVNPYQGDQADFEAYFYDYRDMEGVIYPSKVTHFIDGVQIDEVVYESVDFEAEIPDAMFSKPAAADPDGRGEGGAGTMEDLRVEVPIEYSMKLLFVDVAIADAESTFSFILDTGAGMTCISRGLAEQLGVESTGDMSAAGAGGALDAHAGRIDRLSIGALEVKDLDVMVLDIGPLANMMGRRIDGILGYNVLNRYATTIDIAGETLVFESSDAPLPSGEGRISVPFQVLMGIPVVEGLLNRVKKLDFLVDTGATMSVLPKAVAEELRPEQRLEGAVAAGADSRPIEMGIARYEELSLGDAKVSGPVFSYPLSSDRQDPLGSAIDTANRGVIGTAVLRNFRVTLNYDKATLVLEPVEPPEDAAVEWSGPGLTVFMDRGSAVVRSVFKNGPADGLIQAGDRILEIDGRSVDGKNLEEIMRMLQGAPGSKLEMVIERSGARSTLAIERKRLL